MWDYGGINTLTMFRQKIQFAQSSSIRPLNTQPRPGNILAVDSFQVKKPISTMSSKTLYESVMWGTSRQVQDILSQRALTLDDNWTDYALLMSALRRKHKGIAKILLAKGCRARKPPGTVAADAPLHHAVRMAEPELVGMLLEKGANVDAVDGNGETPLHAAMKKASFEVVDLMLAAVAEEPVNAVNASGFSHFHIACVRNNVKVVERFLKSGIDVNGCVNLEARGWPGYTALHFAVEHNCVEVVRMLMSHGANQAVKNAEGKTPLHLAVQNKNDEIADVLLSFVDNKHLNPADENGLSHFHIACMKFHVTAVENFLRRGVDVNEAVEPGSDIWPGYTPLHFAVRGLSANCEAQMSVIELILKHSAYVNTKDIQGQTPLHLACMQSDDKILRFIKDIVESFEKDIETSKSTFCEKLSQILGQNNQVKIVDLLLRHNSDVNAVNVLNETPLFYLYKYDRSKIVGKITCGENVGDHIIKEFNKIRNEILKILLKYNAQVNVRDEMGQSILHLIAGISKAHDDQQKEAIAELVLNRGADVNAQTEFGLTPLHLAAKNGHASLVELLLRRGANVNAEETLEHSMPLHLATTYQQPRVIDVLLAHGADVTATKNGMNVLHIMALMNPEASEEPEFIESYDKIMATFIERGCDINAQEDINGRTPLHLASWEHNNAATWAFLLHFADINVEDFADQTPMSFPINGTERCREIFYMFHDYINMLKLTGLPVSRNNKACYTEMYKRIVVNTGDDFLVQCREEIERMKGVRINHDTTLYDVMFKTPCEMVVYAGNEVLTKLLSSADFEQNYNVYRKLLESQFRKGLEMKTIMREAKESLESMIGGGLPDSCAEKIFTFLSVESLNDLIKARTVIIPHKTEYASLDMAIAFCQQLADS